MAGLGWGGLLGDTLSGVAEQPSPRTFWRAFTAHWLDAMSGPLSVPLTIGAFVIPNRALAVATGLAGYACLIFSSYRVWFAERSRVVELEKVDRCDLQHMLGGAYYGSSFIYKDDPVLCKAYTGSSDLEHLKHGFDKISIRAPRNATASLQFRFVNGRATNTNYAFYYLDALEKSRKVESLHEHQNILLDDKCQFGLKLVCSNDFEINELASLAIFVVSWSK